MSDFITNTLSFAAKLDAVHLKAVTEALAVLATTHDGDLAVTAANDVLTAYGYEPVGGTK